MFIFSELLQRLCFSFTNFRGQVRVGLFVVVENIIVMLFQLFPLVQPLSL